MHPWKKFITVFITDGNISHAIQAMWNNDPATAGATEVAAIFGYTFFLRIINCNQKFDSIRISVFRDMKKIWKKNHPYQKRQEHLFCI